jgi:polar amino acid transport system substrate-binding protein
MLLRELGAATGCEFRIRRVLRARLLNVFELVQAYLLQRASASPSRERRWRC